MAEGSAGYVEAGEQLFIEKAQERLRRAGEIEADAEQTSGDQQQADGAQRAGAMPGLPVLGIPASG